MISLLTAKLGSSALAYGATGVSGLVVAWILKKIPNETIKAKFGLFMYGLGVTCSLGLSKFKLRGSGQTINPWVIQPHHLCGKVFIWGIHKPQNIIIIFPLLPHPQGKRKGWQPIWKPPFFVVQLFRLLFFRNHLWPVHVSTHDISMRWWTVFPVNRAIIISIIIAQVFPELPRLLESRAVCQPTQIQLGCFHLKSNASDHCLRCIWMSLTLCLF